MQHTMEADSQGEPLVQNFWLLRSKQNNIIYHNSPAAAACNAAWPKARSVSALTSTDQLAQAAQSSTKCFSDTKIVQSGAAKSSAKRARPTSRRIPAIQKTLAVFVQVQ
jgi:hypothetical protein